MADWRHYHFQSNQHFFDSPLPPLPPLPPPLCTAKPIPFNGEFIFSQCCDITHMGGDAAASTEFAKSGPPTWFFVINSCMDNAYWALFYPWCQLHQNKKTRAIMTPPPLQYPPPHMTPGMHQQCTILARQCRDTTMMTTMRHRRQGEQWAPMPLSLV